MFLESIFIAHPAEQVANWIADGKSIEIVSLQPASAQASESLGRQQCQRPQHGVTRAIVPGDVEPDAILGGQEGIHGPIPTVALVPNRAAILEFDEGL